MPGTNSPKVTMADKNFLPIHKEDPASRRWTCPDDQTVAAYVDGELPDSRKKRLESHLARCEPCRSIVADLVKLQREVELPAPPLDIAQKTMRLAPVAPALSHWIWTAAGATAIILVTISIILVRQQQIRLVISAPSPHAPIVAKAEPVISPSTREKIILRRSRVPELRPVIFSPAYDSAVVREHLQFKWKPISGCRYYEISVVTSEGEPLWQSQTAGSTIQIPADVSLKDGSYFVWIVANFANGKQAKSAPVRFQVTR